MPTSGLRSPVPITRAISIKTPTPDPPSFAPSIGSSIRSVSLSAILRVSQWAARRIRLVA